MSVIIETAHPEWVSAHQAMLAARLGNPATVLTGALLGHIRTLIEPGCLPLFHRIDAEKYGRLVHERREAHRRVRRRSRKKAEA